MIAAARARGLLPLAAAWLASAGILYPLAAGALSARSAPGTYAPACNPAALTALPPNSLVIAPPDVAAYGIAATRLRFLAAPYHRNNAGNLAAYRFLLSDEAHAKLIAVQTHADYVLSCGDLGGISLPSDSIAARLRRGDPPVWLIRTGEPALFRMARPR